MKKFNMPQMSLRAQVDGSEINAEKRTAKLVWGSGAKVLRSEFWTGERFFEQLSMDESHVRMERLASGNAPFLNSHSSRSLEDVIGVVESAEVSNGEGSAEVRFSKRESVEPIWQDVIDGVLRNISVGYVVHKFERQPMTDGEEIPTYLAVDWEPVELSAVPIGADADASFRSQGGDKQSFECELVQRTQPDSMVDDGEVNEIAEDGEEENDMKIQKDAPANDVQPDLEQVAREAVASERKRVNEINMAVRAAKLGNEFAEKLINDAVSVDEARKQVIEKLAEKSDATDIRGAAHITAGAQDEKTTLRAGIENSILVRAGIESAPSEIGRRFHGLSLIEMARKATGLDSGSASTVASRALSSSDFPLVLGNVSEKMLMKAYTILSKTFEPFITLGTLADYKPAKRYQIGDAPSLAEIAEGGEYTAGAFGEKAEAISLVDHGRMIKFTRQMLINDDLQAFQRVIGNFASAASRLESAKVYGILTGNPTMADGAALFHGTHKNLASGTIIDVTNLALAEKLLMDQTTLDGADYLGLVAKFLICGTAKKVSAQQILSAQMTSSKSSDVNPFMGAMQLIVDPRIAGNKWFLAASPSDIASIELAYLDGESGPVVDSKEGWDSDGLEVKCRHTVAVKALEHKGLVYNPGN